MPQLVLVRHGQSQWNLDNRFTGWVDVDLSAQGREEATRAGRLLREAKLGFDVAYTSYLRRAIRTLWHILDETDLMWIPVHNSWRLNERHYGGLTGLDKAETAAQYGEQQVHIWRRSYDIPPPAMTPDHPFYTGNDPRYQHLPAGETVPLVETLKSTIDRLLPYWESDIAPSLLAGQRVIVAAHGNSLRGLVKHLEGISDQAILELNIPTGVPRVYDLDEQLGVRNAYYLE